MQGNFVYIPGEDPATGELVTLGELQHDYLADSFVLVRYAEPRICAIRPEFYKVVSRRQVTGFLTGTVTGPASFRPCISREAYLAAVARLKDHIQQGDIYEVNYCVRFTANPAAVQPLALFRELCTVSKAPYRMLAKLGDEYILCASPELFLSKSGGRLRTKPIKGTISRGADAPDDALRKTELSVSHKDRTENVMAVDVARNDLSRVATRGSVAVEKLCQIETFATVHQMVSTVTCTLRDKTSFSDILEATFPMASMTGAPKRKAMELAGIHECFDRGPYSGTMGIIDRNGDFELPVLIRSLFYNTKLSELWFATGGAITHLSQPQEEYEECLLKARTMLNAANGTIGHPGA